VIQQADSGVTSSSLSMMCKAMGVGVSSAVALFLVAAGVFIFAGYHCVQNCRSPALR
jgi:vacuolar-type H+-ATPase subunit I/STV1